MVGADGGAAAAPVIWALLLAACGGPGEPATCAQVFDTNTDTAEPVPAWYTPPAKSTWHWQLQGALEEAYDVDVVDLDLLDTSADKIAAIQGNGSKVVCYFSAGTVEDWRGDAGDFPPAAIGEPMDDWEGENWLDLDSMGVRAARAARLDIAVQKGCDAVEPDNVDGYLHDTGFELTQQDTIDFVRWLASEGHTRGLGVGLKNAVEVIDELVDDTDFAVSESCLDWDECLDFQPFLDRNKAVFHVEYVNRPAQGESKRDQVCADETRACLSTIIKTWDLDAWGLSCP